MSKISHVTVLYDQANRFGSLKCDTLDTSIGHILRPEDRHYGYQTVQSSSTLVKARYGEMQFRPGHGAFMCDAFVFSAFANHTRTTFGNWQMEMARTDDNLQR